MSRCYVAATWLSVAVFAAPVWSDDGAGQSPAPAASPQPPSYSEYVQVTATRIPEESGKVPAAIDVIGAEELRDRGASDLAGALALAAGVDVAPGGDGGPASSVPEFWGLKEFDAFVLVVDGVPWGGAFNPALATLDLGDVERIEVQRGAAPVMYGATSFVGVVHVVRRAPAATPASLTLSGGSYESGSGAFTARLPKWSGFDSALTAELTRRGFKDERTSWRRGHVLWRNLRSAGNGTWRFDVDGTWLDQDPASPHVRQGRALTTLTALDANHNPQDARLDEKRLFVNAGHDRVTSFGTWNTTLAFTRADQDVLRGFLTGLSGSAPNAAGFRADIGQTDVYFDTHLAWTGSAQVKGVVGVDHLHGGADVEGDVFDYFVHLDGSGAPSGARIPREDDRRIENRRDFSGLYGFVEWNPVERVSFEVGARLNRTDEEREEGREAPGADGRDARDVRDVLRLSGSAAAAFTVWEQGGDRVRLFADYKNSFKPAAVDFNLQEGASEAGRGILAPETAQSVEGGLKARLAHGRLSLEASAFLMDFHDLVVSQVVAGLPALRNVGAERFKGVEVSAVGRVAADLYARGSYAWHDARFRDFLTEFDGVPTQLAGKRLEMSAHHLAAGALTYAPARGLVASLEGDYTGSRFLNKRNTAPAEGYFTYSASLGWRGPHWEGRISGHNLGDRRDPVAESELGDAQYYRLPARRFDASVRVTF